MTDIYLNPATLISNGAAVSTSNPLPVTPIMADGTAAAPGLPFANDPDTGLYLAATNTLGITAAGSSVATFGPSAMELIGTFTQTYTDTSTSTRPVMTTWNLTAAPASAPVSSTHLHGAEVVHTTSGSNFNSNTQLYSFEVTGQHSGSGNIYQISAIMGNPISNGGGTVTQANAFFARGQTYTGSTITSGVGYSVQDWLLNGGTITTLYGVKIENLTAGTTNYAIYSGTGTVRFGDTTRVDRTTTGICLRASTNTSNEPAGLPSSAALIATSYWNGGYGAHITAQNTGTGAYIGQIGGSGKALIVDGSTSGATLMEVTNAIGSGMNNAAVLFTRLTPFINQSGTNSYTVLDINPTETATGSGAKLLIDGRIGGGSSVFKVDNGGNVTQASLSFAERTAPSAPAADSVIIYAQDNGAGKTQLMALFSSGAAQQIAIQP